MKRFVIPLLLAATPATAQTSSSACVPLPLAQTYVSYLVHQWMQGSAHVDGWNLDEMGLRGADRQQVMQFGQQIEGQTK